MSAKPFGLAVKAIIRNGQGEILLLRRSARSEHFAGTWEFPGGKVDAGEPFDTALLRETAEETGLTISLDKVTGATHYEMPAIRLAVLFIEATAISGEVCLSDEHDECCWVPLAELGDLDMSEQLHEFVAAYLQRVGRPRVRSVRRHVRMHGESAGGSDQEINHGPEAG